MVVEAGIVTFEPDIDLLRQNVANILPQVARVSVFDNGSSNAATIVELASEFAGVEVILGGMNFGIAYGLNRLAQLAFQGGATHLLTLDQDSVAAPDMVAHLQEAASPSIGMVAPYIVDINKETVQDYKSLLLPAVDEFRQAARRGAITSGALLRLSAWRDVGGFDDELFIDYVDYDLNQRLLLNGYRIVRANKAHLLHEVGRAAPTWLWVPRKSVSGRWRLERFYSFGHSSFRCYYKARNRILFTKKYGRAIGMTHEGVWQLPQQILLTLLFEEDRVAKARAFARGVRDGVRTAVRPEAF